MRKGLILLALALVATLIAIPLGNLQNTTASKQTVDLGAYFIFDDCTKHKWQIKNYSQFISRYTAMWYGSDAQVYTTTRCYDFTSDEGSNLWLQFFNIKQHQITVFLVDNRVPHLADWLGVADLSSGVTHVQISDNVVPDSKILSHELAHQLADNLYDDPRISYSWVHCMADNYQYNNMTISKIPFYYIKPYDGSVCKHGDNQTDGLAHGAAERYLDWRLGGWAPRDGYDFFMLEYDGIANCTSWQVYVPTNHKPGVQFNIAHLYDDTMLLATLTVEEDTVIEYCTPAGLDISVGMLIFQDTESEQE